MKKLMTMMIGLGLILGTTTVFAQDKPADTPKKEKKAKTKKAKKEKAPPAGDTTKK